MASGTNQCPGLSQKRAWKDVAPVDARPDVAQQRWCALGVGGDSRAVDRTDGATGDDVGLKACLGKRCELAGLDGTGTCPASQRKGEGPWQL